MFVRKNFGKKGTGPFSERNLAMVELNAKSLAAEKPEDQLLGPKERDWTIVITNPSVVRKTQKY